jgi:hypothetical protein
MKKSNMVLAVLGLLLVLGAPVFAAGGGQQGGGALRSR